MKKMDKIFLQTFIEIAVVILLTLVIIFVSDFL